MTAGPVPLVGVFRGTGNTILDGDDAFVAMLGLSRSEFEQALAMGRSLSPDDAVELDLAALRLTAATGTAPPYQKDFWHRDGHRVPVLVTGLRAGASTDEWIAYAVNLESPAGSWTHPVAPTDGSTIQPDGYTEQLIGELATQQTRLSSMLDSTTALVWAVDLDLRLTGSNATFDESVRSQTGRTLQVGDPVLDAAVPAEARIVWEEWYRRSLAGESFDQRIESVVGIVYDVHFSPALARDGSVIGVSVVGTNVTTEHRALSALQRRERLLAMTGRLVKVAGWYIDGGSGTVEFSDELRALLDLRDSVTDLETAIEAYPTDQQGRVRGLIRRCLEHGESFDLEVPMRTPVGRDLWIRILGEADRDEKGEIVGVNGAVGDITARRRNERQLRQQAGLLENATDAILVRDVDGIVTFWNRAAEQLYGWTAAEAVGRHVSDLVDGGDRSRYEELEERLWADGEWSGRLENLDRDGNEVVIELHVNVIRDELGTPVSIFSIASDITDRIRLEERLALSQRLESVGQLTGGLAHDFNNLLTVIMGGSELIEDSAGDDPELASLAHMITTAAQRGAELTARLLTFARRQPLQPQVVDAAEVVREMLALLQRSLPESIHIELRAADGPLLVSIDAGQLEAALMNLALNSRDAMPTGGRLTFAVERTQLTPHPTLGIAGGPYVRLSVSDTGTGIDADTVERVFDPFFTTKDPGKGTGLGLSMVYGFIRQSGGHVELVSEPGSGTTVELLLPAVTEERSSEQRPLRSDDDVPTGTERVLVVEDEPLVRRQTVTVLTRLGYEVIEACDAEQARRIIDEAEASPGVDLLFTDIVMPGGTSGVELANELHARYPELKVLLTSGYADEADPGALARFPLLQKPYRRSVLADTVRRTLDGR